VQSIAIAALAANKLSGGLIGSGIGNLAGGLLKLALGSLRTITAGNVTVVGANVTGGGIPGVASKAAGGGTLLTAAKFVLGPAAAVIIGSEIAAAINEPTIAPARTFAEGEVTAKLASQDVAKLTSAINGITDQQKTSDLLAQTTLIASNIPFIGDALGHVGPELEKQRVALESERQAILDSKLDPSEIQDRLADINKRLAFLGADNVLGRALNGQQIAALKDEKQALVAKLDILNRSSTSIFEKSRATVDELHNLRISELTRAAAERGQNNALLAAQARATAEAQQTAGNTARNAATAERMQHLLDLQSGSLAAIAAKPPPSISVRVTAVTNLTVSNVLRTITSSWIAASATGAGPALSESAL
jgi:hypothetical protein